VAASKLVLSEVEGSAAQRSLGDGGLGARGVISAILLDLWGDGGDNAALA
jgi:hypothetical protein